jgi:hypothetical protein
MLDMRQDPAHRCVGSVRGRLAGRTIRSRGTSAQGHLPEDYQTGPSVVITHRERSDNIESERGPLGR